MTDTTTIVATETQDANPGGQQGDAKPTFTAEQQAELNRIVAREKQAAAAKAKADAKAERDAADEEARKAKDADDARKAGDFEKVESQLRGDLITVTGERDGLKAENDRLRAAIEGVVKAEWKELPAEVRDAYLGADDDPLAKLVFLPKGKALAEKIAGSAQRGNGPNPPVATSGRPSHEQIVEDKRRSGAYRPL